MSGISSVVKWWLTSIKHLCLILIWISLFLLCIYMYSILVDLCIISLPAPGFGVVAEDLIFSCCLFAAPVGFSACTSTRPAPPGSSTTPPCSTKWPSSLTQPYTWWVWDCWRVCGSDLFLLCIARWDFGSGCSWLVFGLVECKWILSCCWLCSAVVNTALGIGSLYCSLVPHDLIHFTLAMGTMWNI